MSVQSPVATSPVPAVPERRGRRRRVQELGGGGVRFGLFALVGLYLFIPFLATLLYSLATVWRSAAFPDGLTLRWWAQTLADDRLLAALGRSIGLALLTVLLVNLIVVPALYWARVHNPLLRTAMQLCSLLPFALPFLVIAYGIKNLAGITPFTAQFESSVALVVLAHVALSFPFLLWPLDAAMAASGVQRLHEAAAASGAGPGTTLVRVVIPAVRGGILAGSMLVFATSFGEYSVARIITGTSFETLPLWQVAELNDTSGNPNGVAVMTVASLVLLLVISAAIAVLGRGQAVRLLPGAGEAR